MKTITVRPRVIQSSVLGPLVAPAPQANVAPPQWAAAAPGPAAVAPPSPVTAETVGTAPAAIAQAAVMPAREPAPLPPPPGARPGILGTLPIQTVSAEREPIPASAPAALPAMAAQRAEVSRSGWMIQLGAFADEAEAKQRLRSAQSMAHSLLANTDGFTERVLKGSKELYRARFAGFDKEKAEAACHYFKRNDIACMTLRN